MSLLQYHGYLIYIFAIVILASALFIMLTSDNYLRKIIGLCVFQSAVLVFYIALGKVTGGIVPIEANSNGKGYTSPLPHVLMLTAIVVGFATLAVGLALIHRIYKAFGSLSETEINKTEEERP